VIFFLLKPMRHKVFEACGALPYCDQICASIRIRFTTSPNNFSGSAPIATAMVRA
jgi:hypothetical protein